VLRHKYLKKSLHSVTC